MKNGAQGWLARGAIVFTIALGISPSVALASPIDDARELVYRGDDLYLEGHYEEALSAYQRAVELIDVPTTRVEVAKTLYALGRWLEAYEVAKTMNVPPGEDEPPAFAEARGKATALRREIDARLPTVRVVPAAPSDASVVLRSGADKYVGRMGEPIRVDPGTYAVEIQDGDQREPMTVTVRERENKELKLDGKAIVKSRPFSPIAAVSFGVAGAGLLTGLIAGGVYLTEASDLDEACAQGLYSCRVSERSRVDRIGWVANTGFIVTGVGATAGILAFVFDRPSSDPATKSGDKTVPPTPKATLSVSPTFVGVTGTF